MSVVLSPGVLPWSWGSRPPGTPPQPFPSNAGPWLSPSSLPSEMKLRAAAPSPDSCEAQLRETHRAGPVTGSWSIDGEPRADVERPFCLK